MFRSLLKVLIFIELFGFAHSSLAEGISLDGWLGYAQGELTNPDGTSVYYNGIALKGRINQPLFVGKGFASHLSLGMRYLDLDNRANGSAQRENGNHIGLGPSFELRMYRFVGGYSYDVMKARHFWVGDNTNKYHEFNYTSQTWHAGMQFAMGRMIEFGVIYAETTATFPKDELGLSKDVPYKDQTFWLKLKITSQKSIGEILGDVFGFKSGRSQ